VAGGQSRTALLPVSDGFPEGFDTANLQEASVLLVELTASLIAITLCLACGTHFFETHALSMGLENETSPVKVWLH
jgi:hypothetical protein